MSSRSATAKPAVPPKETSARKPAAPAQDSSREPAPSARSRKQPGSEPTAISAEERRALIAQAAYFRAEKRGFAPGGEERDWLEAEAEVDALLAVAVTAPVQAPRAPRRAVRSAPGKASS